MNKLYTNYDQLPIVLNADQLALALGISRANAYQLMHSKGFPTLRIGKRMLVPKDKFLEWLDSKAETIVERTQTGKAVARQDPNFKDGRPKKFKPEQIELALSLLAQGKTYRQITTMTGISKSTLIRAKHNV